MESPPYRGVKRAGFELRAKIAGLELGTTRHCCAPRGLIARSFEMRWTVPVPMPSGLATVKIPKSLRKLLSHLSIKAERHRHSQCSRQFFIRSPCQHPPFAERPLWNIGAATSLIPA